MSDLIFICGVTVLVLMGIAAILVRIAEALEDLKQ